MECGCPGKAGGMGAEGSPPTGINSVLRRPRMESSGDRPRDPHSPPARPPGRVSPRRLTYELAHGGGVGIPVALPKRHSGSREPGPGNPPPPAALRLPTPPARCPWLLLLAGAGGGGASCGRCGVPGSGRGRGAESRAQLAPAARALRGAPRIRCGRGHRPALGARGRDTAPAPHPGGLLRGRQAEAPSGRWRPRLCSHRFLGGLPPLSASFSPPFVGKEIQG